MRHTPNYILWWKIYHKMLKYHCHRNFIARYDINFYINKGSHKKVTNYVEILDNL